MIDSLYDKYKYWSKTGSVYIISDTHFDDSDCSFMDSKWLSPLEHIALLKKYCHKNDTLIILGDVGNPEYLKAIKSYKVLIMGNHDKGKENYKEYFDEIYEGALFISDRILLSHESIAGLTFCLNIHGHNHSGIMKQDDYHLNVASNVCGYTPINLKEEIKKGILKPIIPIHRQTIDKRF